MAVDAGGTGLAAQQTHPAADGAPGRRGHVLLADLAGTDGPAPRQSRQDPVPQHGRRRRAGRDAQPRAPDRGGDARRPARVGRLRPRRQGALPRRHGRGLEARRRRPHAGDCLPLHIVDDGGDTEQQRLRQVQEIETSLLFLVPRPRGHRRGDHRYPTDLRRVRRVAAPEPPGAARGRAAVSGALPDARARRVGVPRGAVHADERQRRAQVRGRA